MSPEPIQIAIMPVQRSGHFDLATAGRVEGMTRREVTSAATSRFANGRTRKASPGHYYLPTFMRMPPFTSRGVPIVVGLVPT
jgi:hypothetical protein